MWRKLLMSELAASGRRNNWIVIGIVLAVLGIGVSTYSILHHLEVKASGQTDAACNINDTFSCDEVALSSYSEILGVPLGVYGFGYFLALAVLLAIAIVGGKTAKEHLHAYAALVAVGFVVSIVLAAISHFSIGAYCLSCIGIYTLTLLQAIVLFLFKKEVPPGVTANSLFSGGTSAAIAVAAVVAIFLFWAPGQSSNASSDSASNSSEIPKYSEKTSEIPIAKSAYAGLGEDYRKGPDNASVIIQEFADFQCPACQRVSAVIAALAKEFPNRVQVVFRNYPLDNSCNGSIKNKMHEHACKAAVMARCAGNIGKFWEYHDRIFALQSQMNSSFLKAQGKAVGLSDDQIANCWDNNDILTKIRDDISLGNQLGVNSTPTLYINGRKYLGGKSLNDLRAEVELLTN
jgi:protein-disulfide isomerase